MKEASGGKSASKGADSSTLMQMKLLDSTMKNRQTSGSASAINNEN